jgi:hypothetical protein
MPDSGGERGEPVPAIVNVAACPEALPAHDRATDHAINVVGWAVDNAGTLLALAVSADGSLQVIAHERVVFDHAVRPTDY